LEDVRSEAAAEFQKFLDHRGIVLNEPIGSTRASPTWQSLCDARYGQGSRCLADGVPHPLEKADPDIPVLKQAKAEYAQRQ